MDSNLVKRVSQIIEIEDDVIDLDGAEKTPEEVIYEWDAKIRKKLSMFAVADNENTLWDLMKEYLQLLQEVARSYEDNETLKNKVFSHISFLYSYYVELQCWITPDNYLSNMEDILTLYCNLELEVIRPLKKKDFGKHIYKKRIISVSRRIIQVLTVYLLERHDHILHVLIKMNTSNATEACAEVLKILYQHFLIKVPESNLSDESFCRYYIVFQKWKEIRKIEEWEGMDKVMYKMFRRTPESIKNNETLRQIIMPSCTSTVDIVLNLFRSFRDISTAYFRHISAKKKNSDLDDLDFNIDLGEDELAITLDDDNDEEVSFMKAYYEVERNMSNLSHNPNATELDMIRKCKEEIEEDDDVQFVGITVLPKQPTFDIVIDYMEKDNVMSNLSGKEDEEEAASISAPPTGLPPTQKESDIETLNGISRICVGSPKTVSDVPKSPHPIEVETVEEPSTSAVCSIKEVISACDVSTETDQPEVPLLSKDTQIRSPSSPLKTVSDTAIHDMRTIKMKSVEVQADNYIYNDYGLTTPPFDVAVDEQASRPVEPRLYTDIGQNHKNLLAESISEKTAVQTRTIEVQVGPPSGGKNCPYNDYGLTPPNDTHLDDHSARVQEKCLYTNIGRDDLSDQNDPQEINTHSNEVPQIDNVAQENIEIETENRETNETPTITKNSGNNINDELNLEHVGHDSEDEFDDQTEISDVAHIDAEYEIENRESCHETHSENIPLNQNENVQQIEVSEHEDNARFEIRVNPELQVSEPDSSFKTTDQIDTGQKVILNTAPNIVAAASVASTETKDPRPPETYNGNTILKPLISSNRTNGQTKEISSTPPSKIMYTSSQKIKAVSLDDFSRFESAIHDNQCKENNEFDDIVSGPVSKTMSTKHTNLLSAQDKLHIFGQESNSKSVMNASSRSNSPNEMTSPAYEDIDDFRNYFSSSVNGRVPPAHDVKVSTGILKKNNSGKRKNLRIMFHEDFEERRPRSDGVLVLKRVRRDRKLNMEPRVVVERLSFIENKMKKVLNNPPTLRIDYDKTTTHINEKDVVRCISPPRFSWILNIAPNRPNAGSLTVKNREHLEKKPKKRRFETPINNVEDSGTRKRAFRTPQKKSIAGRGGKGIRGRKNSSSSENTIVSKSDSEFDKLLNSGAYTNKPFRLDLTS